MIPLPYNDVIHLFAWHTIIALLFYIITVSIFIKIITRDKIFKYYTWFNLFLIIYILTKWPYYSLNIEAYNNSRYFTVNWYLQMIFYSFYFIFACYYFKIPNNQPKIYQRLKSLIVAIFTLVTIAFIYATITDNPGGMSSLFIYFYIPALVTMSLYIIYLGVQTVNPLKYYFIIGSVSYLIFAAISLAMDEPGPYYFRNEFHPIVLFYIGVFLETRMFSFGLGLRIRDIYTERVNSQQDAINKQAELVDLQKSFQDDLRKELAIAKEEIITITKEAEREKLEKVKAEFENELTLLKMKSLQSQMNPHFIFNALNSIKLYVLNNNSEKSVYYLSKFAKLIRNILQGSNKDYINLKEEIDILELYISIENLRFDDAINYRLNISDDVPLLDIKLPPLLLQPVVENAIWHGLMQKKGEKNLSIDIISKDDTFIVSITDNGIGRKASLEHHKKRNKHKSSLGLSVTDERITQFNKLFQYNIYTEIVDINKDGNLGTKVNFIFPNIINNQEKYTYEHVQKT